METKVEELKDNRAKVTVTVDAKEIDARIKKTYKDFAVRYNFPGFRKGKAPRPVIDNALGAEAVAATVTDEVVNEFYPLAIDENNLYTIDKPAFDDDMGLAQGGKDFSFTFEVALKPEYTLSSYEPVEVELPAEGASDAEVEEQIAGLQEHYYDLVDASAAIKVKPENYVDLAMKATDDKGADIDSLVSDSRLYGLGTGMFGDDFDQEILGLKKGQSKEFTLDVPAVDAPVMLAPLAGKTKKVNFNVTVTVVKNKVVPELTDEWVKETLGFENVADLRERVAESIKQQKDEILPRMKENQCLTALADRLEGEVPASMCEETETNLLQDFFQQLQRQGATFDTYLMQQGITPDQFKDDIKRQALEMTKQDLALDAYAKHAGMTATDEDVTAEFVKSGAEDPKALQEQWRKNGQLHMVRAGILRTNAVKEIMDQAIVSEPKPADEKKPAKKTATKKTATKAADEKKPAAKKTATKKTTKKDEAAEAAAEAPAAE